jgi:16S rRNA (adenine1518-N6/adenine1519-N6)-dimethyltransferase
MKPIEVGQSPDEVFDVVDGRDIVVGREFRRDIHRRGLLHRAIHIFWLRSDGLLCLQRRSYAKDNCPGLLSSSCAGHVDSGEDYLGAAVRELHEELGVAVTPAALREVDYAPWHVDLGNEFVRTYILRGDHPTKLAQFEVDSLLWRTPAEVESWIKAEPAVFATPLCHLLQRSGVRRALGLSA